MTLPSADERVLVLAPLGRDATLTSAILGKSGLVAEICTDLAALCAQLRDGAGAVLMTAEALTPTAARCLVAALNEQPPWSDLPLVVLTSASAPQASQRIVEWLGPRA